MHSLVHESLLVHFVSAYVDGTNRFGKYEHRSSDGKTRMLSQDIASQSNHLPETFDPTPDYGYEIAAKI